MNQHEVVAQSRAAYRQWAEKWRRNATAHAAYPKKPLVDFQLSGLGKACLVVANGYSLEENIDVLRAGQGSVDIACVDKALPHLIRNGIKPKFCMVADASVSVDYLEPVKDELQDTILFMNVCGNPEWTAMGNWKEVYFYVNRDACQYEKEFSALSGCDNLIPAGTNVSNALLVLLTQTDNGGPQNFFAYDKYLLLGFDYCWDDDGYYAFDKTGNGKANYMRMIFLHDLAGRYVYTSSNLLYSVKWLNAYVTAGANAFSVFQTSDRSIFAGRKLVSLAEQLTYAYRPEDSQAVISLLEYRRKLEAQIIATNAQIFETGREHYRQMIRTT